MEQKKLKFEMVPVDSLNWDVKNPRVAQWITMYTNVDEAGMRLALGRGGADDGGVGPSYVALKQSIRTNGGVIHPIIVNREPNGKMTVIEGNTRMLIYKEFKQAEYQGNWDTIPAIIYDNMAESQIDAIRLQVHLVGTRDWDPYSKAKYLDTLRNRLNMPWALVVDYCGGNQRDLQRLISAYGDMEQYYRPIVEASDQHFDYKSFSGFVELQNPRISEALSTSGYTKTDFSKWINERKLHPLLTIRQLPRILQNAKSRQIFLQNGAEEAIRVLDTLEQPITVSLENASMTHLAKEIYKRINSIQWGEIVRLRTDPDTEEKDILRMARDALVEFWKEITIEDQ